MYEEIRDLALKFFHVRDQKASLAKKEAVAKDELLVAMHAHKLKRYYDVEAEVMVEIEDTEKVRVTIGENDGGEE